MKLRTIISAIKLVLFAAFVLFPGWLFAALAAVSLRGVSNDLEVASSEGSTLYRPDGVDSTLLCLKGFSLKEPTALRVLDLTGEDAYPENFSNLVQIGKQANLPQCAIKTGERVSKARVVHCIDSIANQGVRVSGEITGNVKKLAAQKVNYSLECEGEAQPKNVTSFSSSISVQIPAHQPDGSFSVRHNHR